MHRDIYPVAFPEQVVPLPDLTVQLRDVFRKSGGRFAAEVANQPLASENRSGRLVVDFRVFMLKPE